HDEVEPRVESVLDELTASSVPSHFFHNPEPEKFFSYCSGVSLEAGLFIEWFQVPGYGKNGTVPMTPLTHPVHFRLGVPLRRGLFEFREEFDGAFAGDVACSELGFVPAAERKR